MTAKPFQAGGKRPPSSIVIPFIGPPSNIPDGWVLCDGNNGTPDLRDKHIKCVPDGTTDPGATGGQDSFSLSQSQIPSHTHGGSTDNQADHSHGYGYDEGQFTGSGRCYDGGFTVATAGNHSHTLSIGASGSGNSIDNRPAHRNQNFIQKL